MPTEPNADPLLPYYLAGFPCPTEDRPAGPRRVHWAASLGTATIAGWSAMRRRDVARFLPAAGFTEALVTCDYRKVAAVVAELRLAHAAGRRAGVNGAA